MERSPREIRDAVSRGELDPAEAAMVFQGRRREKDLRVPASQAPIQGEVMIKLKDFHYTQRAPEGYYYDKRVQMGRRVRHFVGLPLYAIVEAIDAMVDAGMFGMGEISEDIGFAATRIPTRFKEGWERGKLR